MKDISKAFFHLKELPLRWGRSLSEIAGWALDGRLNIILPIGPVRCGDRAVAGIVRLPATDIARLFQADAAPDLIVSLFRVLPDDALEPLFVTEPADGIEVRLQDLMLAADDVLEFEEVNGLLSLGRSSATRRGRSKGGRGRPPVYDWEDMLVDVLIDIAQNGLPKTQDAFVELILDWFNENRADGELPDESTARKRCNRIWWRLKERL